MCHVLELVNQGVFKWYITVVMSVLVDLALV